MWALPHERGYNPSSSAHTLRLLHSPIYVFDPHLYQFLMLYFRLSLSTQARQLLCPDLRSP